MVEGERKESLGEPEYNPDPNCLSRAELLVRVREKLTARMVLICPAVKEAIENLKRIKRLRSATEGDHEYKTIIDLDLVNAIKFGMVVSHQELTTEERWELIIHGPDTEGDIFIVTVYLEKDPSAPLQISAFCFPPDMKT